MKSQVPRGWLRTSAGVFSLYQSDRFCGSYLTIEDAARILEVKPDALTDISSVQHGKKRYLTDKQLGRAWASGVIDSPRSRFRRGKAMISFDELIILTLAELTLPDAVIEPQVEVGKQIVDFRICHKNRSIVVEFFGPYHFIRRSLRQKNLVDPRRRVKDIEQSLHQECVIWPYWVQRCASNVRALFETDSQGIGSIWSTSALFGDFAFPDSADIIIGINARFRIERPDGIGYMYTDELVAKPVHPIVKRIREGRENLSKLIPPGSHQPAKYWLPKQLWPLLPFREDM